MNALTIISVLAPFALLLVVWLGLRWTPARSRRRVRAAERVVAQPVRAEAPAQTPVRAGWRRAAQRRVA